MRSFASPSLMSARHLSPVGPPGQMVMSVPAVVVVDVDVKGDYCSTTKSAGGCQDSFWLAATLAASAAEVQATPTDPFCTGSPTN